MFDISKVYLSENPIVGRHNLVTVQFYSCRPGWVIGSYLFFYWKSKQLFNCHKNYCFCACITEIYLLWI